MRPGPEYACGTTFYKCHLSIDSAETSLAEGGALRSVEQAEPPT